MDLQQRKLTKSEWDSIEKPISSNEKEILKLIIDGYEKVGIKYNKQHTILGYLKMEQTPDLDDYVLSRYLLPQIIKMRETCIIPDNEQLHSYIFTKMGGNQNMHSKRHSQLNFNVILQQ